MYSESTLKSLSTLENHKQNICTWTAYSCYYIHISCIQLIGFPHIVCEIPEGKQTCHSCIPASHASKSVHRILNSLGKHEILAYLLHIPLKVCPDMVLPDQNHVYN